MRSENEGLIYAEIIALREDGKMKAPVKSLLRMRLNGEDVKSVKVVVEDGNMLVNDVDRLGQVHVQPTRKRQIRRNFNVRSTNTKKTMMMSVSGRDHPEL